MIALWLINRFFGGIGGYYIIQKEEEFNDPDYLKIGVGSAELNYSKECQCITTALLRTLEKTLTDIREGDEEKGATAAKLIEVAKTHKKVKDESSTKLDELLYLISKENSVLIERYQMMVQAIDDIFEQSLNPFDDQLLENIYGYDLLINHGI